MDKTAPLKRGDKLFNSLLFNKTKNDTCVTHGIPFSSKGISFCDYKFSKMFQLYKIFL